MCSAAQGRYFFKGFKYLGEPLEIENQCHFNNIYIYICPQTNYHCMLIIAYPTQHTEHTYQLGLFDLGIAGWTYFNR